MLVFALFCCSSGAVCLGVTCVSPGVSSFVFVPSELALCRCAVWFYYVADNRCVGCVAPVACCVE